VRKEATTIAFENKHGCRTRRVALVVSLSALCIGTNYAMFPLSNVKLMDAIVFTTGLVFGFVPGAAVAVVSWLVYGTLNPLGISILVLFTVIPSEIIYPLVGHLLRKTKYGRSTENVTTLSRSVVFGSVGLFATLAYDLITNAVSGLLAYNSIWLGLATMNFPAPLGIIHEASNLVFFAAVVPVLLEVVRKTLPTSDEVIINDGYT